MITTLGEGEEDLKLRQHWVQEPGWREEKISRPDFSQDLDYGNISGELTPFYAEEGDKRNPQTPSRPDSTSSAPGSTLTCWTQSLLRGSSPPPGYSSNIFIFSLSIFCHPPGLALPILT